MANVLDCIGFIGIGSKGHGWESNQQRRTLVSVFEVQVYSVSPNVNEVKQKTELEIRFS